jgi:hypothetical protein
MATAAPVSRAPAPPQPGARNVCETSVRFASV